MYSENEQFKGKKNIQRKTVLVTQLLHWNSFILPTKDICLTPPPEEPHGAVLINFLRERTGIQSLKFKKWVMENCDFHILNCHGETHWSWSLTLPFSPCNLSKSPTSNLQTGMLNSLSEWSWGWNQIPVESNWHRDHCVLSNRFSPLSCSPQKSKSIKIKPFSETTQFKV